MSKYEQILESIKSQEIPNEALIFFEGTPIQVAAICLALDIRIEVKAMAYSGAITFDSMSEKFIISVNQIHSLERRRFTVAHELAHFFLHQDKIKEKAIFYDEPLKRSENYSYNHLENFDEVDANNIAAEILMPRQPLRARKVELLELFGNDQLDYVAELLASEYVVSIPAMRIRLGLPVN